MYDYITHEIRSRFRLAIYKGMWIQSFSLLRSSRLDLDGFFLDLILVLFILAGEIFCFPCNEPISGTRALSMHISVARVEHNGFVGVDALVVVCFLCTLHLAGWWDEAAQANLT